MSLTHTTRPFPSTDNPCTPSARSRWLTARPLKTPHCPQPQSSAPVVRPSVPPAGRHRCLRRCSSESFGSSLRGVRRARRPSGTRTCGGWCGTRCCTADRAGALAKGIPVLGWERDAPGNGCQSMLSTHSIAYRRTTQPKMKIHATAMSGKRRVKVLINSGYFYSTFSSPLLLRGVPHYSIGSVSELTGQNTTGNYEWRTCPRSLLGG